MSSAQAASHVELETADDQRFMEIALTAAKSANYPFGAVIVRDGKVLMAGGNMGGTFKDPTAHGEMVTIRNLVAANRADEMKGATIYTTGEPCPMCMGAILWSGITRLVYAVSIEELGRLMHQINISSREVADRSPFADIVITPGVRRDEALALFVEARRRRFGK